MKRINEAIAQNQDGFTKGQRLLAAFISEHCEKAAFMNSFELAAVSGVSQSTVVRFALALGYDGYAALQQALRHELKYRLAVDSASAGASQDENDIFGVVSTNDAFNIRRNVTLNDVEALKNLCTRLSFSSRIFLYGQGFASIAAEYLWCYLRVIFPNTFCLHHGALGPQSALSGVDSGDLLLCVSFPLHLQISKNLVGYARENGACVVTITESADSEMAKYADINIVSEYGDFNVNGSAAPLISLCGAIVNMLVVGDEKAQKKLRDSWHTADYTFSG